MRFPVIGSDIRLTNTEALWALGMHVGVLPPPQDSKCPFCEQPMTATHPCTCKRVTGILTKRHHEVRKRLAYHLARVPGLTVTEERLTASEGQATRPDIRVQSIGFNTVLPATLVLDVGCVGTLRVAGEAAKKEARYRGEGVVVPATIDVETGAIGDKFRAFISTVAEVARGAGVPWQTDLVLGSVWTAAVRGNVRALAEWSAITTGALTRGPGVGF